jgi:hypothetical protein
MAFIQAGLELHSRKYFKILQIPPDLLKKKTWLCAQLWNEAGGYYPAE